MDCNTCKEKRQQKEPVPFVSHESDMARMMWIIKRLLVADIILLVLLVASNAGWIYYESQFTETEVTQEVDTGDGAAYVAGIGDVYYGESAANG